MKVRRDVPATPKQTAGDAWQAIIGLIADTTSTDADQLVAATGIMEMLISDEAPADQPIVVVGESLRVVLYCLFGDTSLDAESELDKLPSNPTKGEWTLYAPCEADDVAWMTKSLTDIGDRMQVYDMAGDCPADTDTKDVQKTGAPTIDWGALKSA